MVFLGGVVGGVGLRIVPKPRIAITGLHMRLPWGGLGCIQNSVASSLYLLYNPTFIFDLYIYMYQLKINVEFFGGVLRRADGWVMVLRRAACEHAG